MNTFKTPKGTTLPLLSLKGKDYLQVAHRIQWFREEKPSWTISTHLVQLTDKQCVCKASIKDESGRLIAVAHKLETIQGFQDFIEKSETGAIGRALALCGYGTQFTTELEEGARLADAPLAGPMVKNFGVTPTPVKVGISASHSSLAPQQELMPTAPRDYVMKTGKSKGTRLGSMLEEDVIGYKAWVDSKKSKGDNINGALLSDYQAMSLFINEFNKSILDRDEDIPPITDDEIPF